MFCVFFFTMGNYSVLISILEIDFKFNFMRTKASSVARGDGGGGGATAPSHWPADKNAGYGKGLLRLILALSFVEFGSKKTILGKDLFFGLD